MGACVDITDEKKDTSVIRLCIQLSGNYLLRYMLLLLSKKALCSAHSLSTARLYICANNCIHTLHMAACHFAFSPPLISMISSYAEGCGHVLPLAHLLDA
jgi:hypothetical protein